MSIRADSHEPCNHQKLLKIRKKVKEVFGQETSMNDDLLSRRYTLSSEGDLIMIVR